MKSSDPYDPVAVAPSNGPEPANAKLFDVTAVIGSVYSGGDGMLSPRATAFVIIADHGQPGMFTFPDADAMVTVNVEHAKPQ